MALIAGLDEVGWGAIAGPIVSVVVAATEFDIQFMPKGVTDSKKMTPKKRESAFLHLCAAVTSYGIGMVEPWEIDSMGPKFALQESYRRAILELTVTPEKLIVDGSNQVKCWAGLQEVVPKADFLFKQVSAASVIAKVVRDELMTQRSHRLQKMGLPDYGWEVNKGYQTPDHTAAILKHGLLFEKAFYQHRRSYCEKLLGRAPIRG